MQLLQSRQSTQTSGKHAERFKRAGIPERFWKASLGDCANAVREYALGFDGGTTDGLMLHGPSGRGKTHQACAVLMHVATIECKHFEWATETYPRFVVRFETMPGIIAAVRATYGTRQSSAEALSPFYHCGLLCIDDLGKENASPDDVREVYSLIDYRMAHNKPTIVTTNHNSVELGQHFASRADVHTANAIISRLSELRPVHIGGADRRAS